MSNYELDNLEIAPAAVVKQCAHNFSAALADSQHFRNYEQAALRFRQDDAAQADMKAYREKQQSLRPLMRTGAVNLVDQRELEHLYDAWIGHASVMDYLQAQTDLVAYCQSLGAMLSQMLGFDFSEACATNCC